jgi:hypothetical protein
MAHFQQWRAIRLFGEGLQPHLGRYWDCEPAWDVTAIHREADEQVRHPDYYRAQANPSGEFPNRNKTKWVFWDRHIDRRFHVEYPPSRKDSPRAVSYTLGDAGREWDTMIEHRDRYLRDAQVGFEGPPHEVAKALADTFLYDNFETKPMSAFSEGQRELCHPIEGLLHKSFCVGCAYGFAILADVTGMKSRLIGCVGHYVAEVELQGKWHYVESVGRHKPGMDALFNGSYVDTALNPMGDFSGRMSDDLRNGLFKRPNGQYHLHNGTWGSPLTLRYAASNAYALYPNNKRWPVFSHDGKRLPIRNCSGGFYWPSVHQPSDAPKMRKIRQAALPLAMYDDVPNRDYLYHRFTPGQKIRQSFWMGDLDDVESVEIVLTFGPSYGSDFAPEAGKAMLLKVNDDTLSLADRRAWPPKPRGADVEAKATAAEVWNAVVTVRRDDLIANSVNWIELHNVGRSRYYMPCLPAAAQPYVPPLYADTD